MSKHQVAVLKVVSAQLPVNLRAAAYRMAVVGIQLNPVIAAHYARKRAGGKSPMNALGHCIRKALSIVWATARISTPNGDSRLGKNLCDLALDVLKGEALIEQQACGRLSCAGSAKRLLFE
jgi:hypothetical protein